MTRRETFLPYPRTRNTVTSRLCLRLFLRSLQGERTHCQLSLHYRPNPRRVRLRSVCPPPSCCIHSLQAYRRRLRHETGQRNPNNYSFPVALPPSLPPPPPPFITTRIPSIPSPSPALLPESRGEELNNVPIRKLSCEFVLLRVENVVGFGCLNHDAQGAVDTPVQGHQAKKSQVQNSKMLTEHPRPRTFVAIRHCQHATYVPTFSSRVPARISSIIGLTPCLAFSQSHTTAREEL